MLISKEFTKVIDYIITFIALNNLLIMI